MRRLRRREPEAEQDVNSDPPGAGPEQQIGATEAKHREDGEYGYVDRDLHCAVPFGGPAAGGGGAPGGVPPVPEYLCFVSMVTVGVPPSV